jgi:hypothetical protein
MNRRSFLGGVAAFFGAAAIPPIIIEPEVSEQKLYAVAEPKPTYSACLAMDENCCLYWHPITMEKL